jgi:hypothetical protein
VKFIDEIELTGRPPSEVNDWFLEQFPGASLLCAEGDIVNDELGLVIRAQRAGDILLTRPVFVSRRWAYMCGDNQESCGPEINRDGYVIGWPEPEPVVTATNMTGDKVVKDQRVPTLEDLWALFDEHLGGKDAEHEHLGGFLVDLAVLAQDLELGELRTAHVQRRATEVPSVLRTSR